MRIGFILPATFTLAPPGNGIRIQAQRQADALVRAGHEVVRLNPWTYTDGRNLDYAHYFLGGLDMNGIEAMRPDFARRLAMAAIIDSNEPFWRYRLAARLGTMHQKLRTVPGEYRKQAAGSDVVIVRSSHERDRVIRGLGIDQTKVEIVMNGVDPPPPDVDAEGVRRRLHLPSDFLLHVSAYTQDRKNVVRLLEAVGPLEYPVVIAGFATPGTTLDRIRSLARAHSNVTLLGFLDEPTLAGLYAACRVFCLPTMHEGTGLAALEAAALGARVVITKNGGPPDYFLDMAEYVNPLDVVDIRAKVKQAWEKADSDALRKHVLNNLTWDHSAAALNRAYQRHL